MDVTTGQPQLTLQSDSAAEFWLSDLEPGSTFMLYLYAVNVKGLSLPVVLPVSTLKEAAKRTVPPSTDPFSGSVAGAVAMGTGAGLLLVSAIIAFACIRYRRRRNDSSTRLTSLTGPAVDGIHQQYEQQAHINGVGQTNKGRSVHKNGELVSELTAPDICHADDRNAGFYQRPAAARTTVPPFADGNKRTCLKLPPDFVHTMSDVPESCVWSLLDSSPWNGSFVKAISSINYSLTTNPCIFLVCDNGLLIASFRSIQENQRAHKFV